MLIGIFLTGIAHYQITIAEQMQLRKKVQRRMINEHKILVAPFTEREKGFNRGIYLATTVQITL